MALRGLQTDFSHTEWFPHVSPSHFLLFGLMLSYFTTLSSQVQACSMKCKSKNISSQYQHCGIRSDGVHDLDCFGKYYSRGTINCVWKPGNHASDRMHTFIIQQPAKKYCRACHNITQFSQSVKLYENPNMTVEVFENSRSRNCTKAIFRGSPTSLFRCGPPSNVSFSRHSGRLDVNVSWKQEDVKAITYYSVRYKVVSSPSWNETNVESKDWSSCRVEDLNSSLVYIVQIRCVHNEKCSQCPWSEAYTVLPELTTQPVIVSIEDNDINEKQGRRLVSVTWTFSASELHDGYYVSIGKASGEAPCQQMKTSEPEIRLILSHSAYQLNISAANNASVSPAVSQTIPQREDMYGMGEEKLNVTVHNNTSFTIYWKDDLIKTFVCYSVEWREKGHNALYMSFYQNVQNSRTLFPLPEPLEPYKRYSITLHTRPDKETCNMKHINNSESTYGSTQFYFMEGSPISAPANISKLNVTLKSVLLQWSSIPEEDIRGFLLGYIIHYTQYHQRGTSTENNITVDPELNSYELSDLRSGTAYQVQISGFTSGGAGVRSTASFFKTDPENFNLSSVITVFAVVATVLIFGTPIIKRAKAVLWPSIPNPGNSNAMQKIDRACELELAAINTLQVEEWDTNSLQIVEKEAVIPASTLPLVLPLLCAAEDEEDAPEMTCDWNQTDTDSAAGETSPGDATDMFSDTQQTNLQSSPMVFSGGYTTMEMFQQTMPQRVAVNTAVTEGMESQPENMTVLKSGMDYVRQFSTSPSLDSEQPSTILW
ncbi:interleukin-31 receptor subunit alpha isoform X2 [Amphiprion ocellaris]|uniref:Fibronectin type-III domain-containing protein n=1 Tax=Amphiprion ocellaris TaxID=80972 RepID=A0AAQ5Z7M3_AMPOC|nr:interleukin-31 receptor subunit alpha isoform X2 [Amphiprion ocellaris]